MARFFINKVASYKYLLYTVVFLTILIYLFGGLITTRTTITWVEAYILFANSKSRLFLLIFCVFVSMQFPYKDIHIMLRIGKKKWLINELVSMLAIIVCINIFVLVVCCVCFEMGDISEWSKDFIISYMEDGIYGARLGDIGDLTGWVLFGCPVKAALTSFVLMVLGCFVAGLICFIFNGFNRHTYGPFVVIFWYFAPIGIMQLKATRYVVIIMILVVLSMLGQKKMEVR